MKTDNLPKIDCTTIVTYRNTKTGETYKDKKEGGKNNYKEDRRGANNKREEGKNVKVDRGEGKNNKDMKGLSEKERRDYNYKQLQKHHE